MAAKVYTNTTPTEVPNSSEHICSCSQAPSHTDQEFINSILGRTLPEARVRLANETRRVLAQVNLRPHEWNQHEAQDLIPDIVQALSHIHEDDLFSLAILCYRFAACPPEVRAWRGEAVA